MASIALRQLRKHFEGHDVLKGISLDIAEGEFVALVGPSGCGKSTLLRMLAGLEEVSSGQIVLGGQVINEVPPRERNIAMVFQNYALYPHMTVAENLGFALKLQRQAQAAIAQRVQQVAEILGLEPLLGRLPAQLSGGQRQRVARGRAIVREPLAFLFVAQFIGSPAMNLIAARSQPAQDGWQLVTDDGQRLPLLPGLQAQVARELWLGVRPEHVQLEVAPLSGVATSAATVEVVEPTGAETQVVSRFGQQPLISTVNERLALAPGQALHWHTAPQHWHVFDRHSGERLNVA